MALVASPVAATGAAASTVSTTVTSGAGVSISSNDGLNANDLSSVIWGSISKGAENVTDSSSVTRGSVSTGAENATDSSSITRGSISKGAAKALVSFATIGVTDFIGAGKSTSCVSSGTALLTVVSTFSRLSIIGVAARTFATGAAGEAISALLSTIGVCVLTMSASNK